MCLYGVSSLRTCTQDQTTHAPSRRYLRMREIASFALARRLYNRAVPVTAHDGLNEKRGAMYSCAAAAAIFLTVFIVFQPTLGKSCDVAKF